MRFSSFPSLGHSSTIDLLHTSTSLPALFQIHAHLIRTHLFFSNPFLAAKLVEASAVGPARSLDYALRVFAAIARPDSYAWTTLIRSYVQHKLHDDAVCAYYQMLSRRGVAPNNFTFVFVLKAYSFLLPAALQGRAVHGKVVKAGFGLDPYVHSALLRFYSKLGDAAATRRLFDENPGTNVVAWNAVLAATFEKGDLAAARELFDEMLPVRDVASWNVAVSGFCKLGRLDIARALFDEMPKRDLLSWSAMISGYSQCRMFAKAFNLFRLMLDAGVTPDSVTVVSLLSSCGRIGALDTGKWIHSFVARNKLQQDVALGTALVDMYSKCGCLDLAFQVFHSMRDKNLVSWNAMLNGLSVHGRGTLALELFQQMEQREGILPNDITFVGLLSACSHSGLVVEGRMLFNRMRNVYNIVPKIEHYGCMVDLLARAGHIEEAKNLVREMPMEPNVVVWVSLLHACRLHGDADIKSLVDERLQKLAPEDGGCFVLLSNFYAAKDCWEVVTEIRKVMKEDRVEKIPGCSSIEVDGEVHEFLVDSRTHAKCDEIYDNLYLLNLHTVEERYNSGVA